MLPAMSKGAEVQRTKMIKTLRITSITAAILAVVFFVLPTVFGIRTDKQSEQFLNSAGAIEKFNDAKGNKSRKSEEQTSPLVKQAKAFSLYLNPPPKSQKPSTYSKTTRRKPPTVSAKFKLIGTSYYALHPELSLALIDEPGKGFRWVRQSSKVGRLIIEQVKDGLVVVRDGQRTFELAPDRLEKRSLLKSKDSLSEKSSPKHVSKTSGKARASVSIMSGEYPQIGAEEDAMIEAIINETKAVLASIESGEIDSEQGDEKTEALIEELIFKLASERINDEEAERLGDLGEELDSAQKDPNQTEDEEAESSENPAEPNEPNQPGEPNSSA